MITWMQRHKKWLIITIWISTIAFVGAGFVGWGQYSYGDKAGAVAKVGNVEITQGQLQKTYSNLYGQYSQMFQGNFDEEKAKSFGLQSQALRQLTQQALILNLADSYDLEVSDEELLAEIKSLDYFFDNGVFSKEVYKQVLSRNKLSIKEYEIDVKRELLIRKTLKLLPITPNENELNIISTIGNIADKISYKVLNLKDINIDTSDEKVMAYWELMKDNFKTEISYDVKYIKQAKLEMNFDDAKISEYYNENRLQFKADDGKILELNDAKDTIIAALNAKETKKEALRLYIAYKKNKEINLDDLNTNASIEDKKLQVAKAIAFNKLIKNPIKATLSASNNSFSNEILVKISDLTPASPYLKPVKVADDYYIFELVATNKPLTQTYAQAKEKVLPMYTNEQKAKKIEELAKNSVATFKGTVSDFVTVTDTNKLTLLSSASADEFLVKLFASSKKRAYEKLQNGDIVLYNILEQKLLSNTNTNQNNPIVRLKSAMFNEGLVKKLQNKYKTEIFIQGL